MPAIPTQRTLGDLRVELQARLGFASSAQSQTVNKANLDSILRRTQEMLYDRFTMPDIDVVNEVEPGACVAGQTLYDWPTQVPINVRRINGFYVQYGGRWIALTRGIDARKIIDTLSTVPIRYEIRAKLEIYPKPASAYPLRLEYVMPLAAFSAETDVATIDDKIIFPVALATAKAHYRHPDAQTHIDAARSILAKLQIAEHDGRVYSMGGRDEGSIIPIPVVI